LIGVRRPVPYSLVPVLVVHRRAHPHERAHLHDHRARARQPAAQRAGGGLVDDLGEALDVVAVSVAADARDLRLALAGGLGRRAPLQQHLLLLLAVQIPDGLLDLVGQQEVLLLHGGQQLALLDVQLVHRLLRGLHLLLQVVRDEELAPPHGVVHLLLQVGQLRLLLHHGVVCVVRPLEVLRAEGERAVFVGVARELLQELAAREALEAAVVVAHLKHTEHGGGGGFGGG